MTNEIDLKELEDQACSSTGLDDLGEGSWREGAEQLADGLNNEAALHELGNVIASSEITDYLTNRLRIVDWTKRNPEIAKSEIHPPIVILGLPRTGTTILFGLLAQDPANRVPLTWEVDQPWPPPETATYESDPRIADVQSKLEATEFLIPGFLGMHELGARLAQECVRITAGDFRSMIFITQYRLPTYQHWLLHETDMASAYRYHRLYLQYLQSAHPADKWVIKSPAHLWSPWSMMNEYPDALVIQTHRDPVRVLCSLASLTHLLRGLASSEASLDEVARGWADDVAVGLDRVVEARRDGAIPQSQAVDFLFGDFLANPMNVVHDVYERLGIELSKEAERDMRSFLAEHPQEKYGGHKYTFADTGLDAGELRERMRPYQEYFDVPDEALP